MNKKIHILHITESLSNFGGTPIKLLSQVLNSSENFVYTICCIVSEGELAGQFREAGAEVISLDYPKNYDFRQIGALVRIIKEKKIDIVHTHFARSNTYGRIAALLAGKPMIVSEHGVPRNTSLPIRIMDNVLNTVTSVNISNSRATLNSVKQSVLTNRKNMTVIYNGVADVAGEMPAAMRAERRLEFGFEPDDFVVLYVGGLLDWRNHIDLIHTADNLRNSIKNIKFIFVGQGPAHDHLESIVKERQLENHVFIWNYLTRDKVLEVMHCADLYINPAVSEGFGIATVEAMLCRLPVICANSGSLPELIEHNQDGLLYEVHNIDALTTCITQCYNNPDMRLALGQNARQRAVTNFSIKRFVKDFEETYLSVI